LGACMGVDLVGLGTGYMEVIQNRRGGRIKEGGVDIFCPDDAFWRPDRKNDKKDPKFFKAQGLGMMQKKKW